MQIDNSWEIDNIDLEQFMHGCSTEFKPFIHVCPQKKHIRVQFADCSVTEIQLTKNITVLEANHSATKKIVGLIINY